jgi:UPF0176 protein
MQQARFVNIAFYKFVSLKNPESWKIQLKELCDSLQLRGTILLATEGINSCLVGLESDIEAFMSFMHATPEFSDLEFKKSFSSDIPFRRMNVKVKKEIIHMGVSDLDPARETGKYVEPLELKKWLESGEDVVLLDTRNVYEYELGTFQGAITPPLKTFGEFPAWVKENFLDQRKKKVVTFCTGGIRCEKATAFMRREGFEEVYQLQGGVLKYFEETAKVEGDNHYKGDLFVFDNRVAVDQELSKTPFDVCHACWSTLTPDDKLSPLYVANIQCPHCHEKQALKREKRARISKENNERALQRRQERSKIMRAEALAKISENSI